MEIAREEHLAMNPGVFLATRCLLGKVELSSKRFTLESSDLWRFRLQLRVSEDSSTISKKTETILSMNVVCLPNVKPYKFYL